MNAIKKQMKKHVKKLDLNETVSINDESLLNAMLDFDEDEVMHLLDQKCMITSKMVDEMLMADYKDYIKLRIHMSGLSEILMLAQNYVTFTYDQLVYIGCYNLLSLDDIKHNSNIDDKIKLLFQKNANFDDEMTVEEYLKESHPHMATLKKLLKKEKNILTKQALINLIKYCKKVQIFNHVIDGCILTVDLDVVILANHMLIKQSKFGNDKDRVNIFNKIYAAYANIK